MKRWMLSMNFRGTQLRNNPENILLDSYCSMLILMLKFIMSMAMFDKENTGNKYIIQQQTGYERITDRKKIVRVRNSIANILWSSMSTEYW